MASSSTSTPRASTVLFDDDPLVARFRGLFQDKSLPALWDIFTEMTQSVYKSKSSSSSSSSTSRSLNLIEFKIAMIRFQSAKLTFEEIRRIFLWLDSSGNHNGRVEYDEFVAGIRGELAPPLRRMVVYVFRRLDRNSSGYIEETELSLHRRKSTVADAADGTRTPQAKGKAKDLIALVGTDACGSSPAVEGRISLEQLLDYYLTLQVGIVQCGFGLASPFLTVSAHHIRIARPPDRHADDRGRVSGAPPRGLGRQPHPRAQQQSHAVGDSKHVRRQRCRADFGPGPTRPGGRGLGGESRRRARTHLGGCRCV